MDDFSILIGGKAGFGIENTSLLIGHIFNRMGYYVYIDRDYPSIIRGGHTFSLIRVSSQPISANRKQVDFLLALNQDTIDFHKDRLKDSTVIIYDSDLVKSQGINIAIGKIIKEENASDFMRDSCMLGAFFQIMGLNWDFVKKVLEEKITKEKELNLKLVQRGFQETKPQMHLQPLKKDPKSLLTGNEAVSLGLIHAGLDSYVAYPMTPASSILHFMEEEAKRFDLTVIQPESEIGVILMALGFSYMGKKIAVATSGGGFCLMTEGLSLAAIAELPIVIVMAQRPGPATGVPTYSGQGELNFVLHAGHGEFTKFIVAPGDATEAFYWGAVSLNLSWKYQIPSMILSDKTLAESLYDFDAKAVDSIEEEKIALYKGQKQYQRYADTQTGISPLAFVPQKDQAIKINSYEHDQMGITTEEPEITKRMQEKRMRKEQYLTEELEKYPMLQVYGNKKASQALLCWGSNKGVCIEAAKKFDMKVIHIQVLHPFPVKQLQEAMKGVQQLICMENNITGQMANIVRSKGWKVAAQVVKYNGRPFSIEELEMQIQKVRK